MTEASCIMPTTSKAFAKKVVDAMTNEQLSKYGINSDEKKGDAINAIKAIVDFHIGKRSKEEQDELLQRPEDFIQDFEKYFSVTKVHEEDLDKAQEQYNELMNALESWAKEYNLDLGRLGSIEFDEDEETQNAAKFLMALLGQYQNLIFSDVERYNDRQNIKSITFIIKEPQKSEEKNRQDLALETIEKIQEIQQSKYPVDYEIKNSAGQVRFIKMNFIEKGWKELKRINYTSDGNFERVITNGRETKTVKAYDIPAGFKRTGRNRYSYNGNFITVNSISNEVERFDPTPKYPVLAGVLGTVIDKTSRWFFGKTVLYKDIDGKKVLKDDKELRAIIDSELKGMFTLQGLKNLLNDYEKLEEELKEKWGKWGDIKIISEDFALFGQKEDGSWVTGKPDLLIVDGRGVVHVLDFKSSKMSGIKENYNKAFSDDKLSRYSKQVSNYIELLKSYGLQVDDQPYLIAIDTWYVSSDLGYLNYNEEGELENGKRDIYNVDNEIVGIKDETEEDIILLREYSEENEMPTREEALIPENDILYMEPRLHVKVNDDGKFSEELAALRGSEEGVNKDNGISFKTQWEELSENEKAELRWLKAIPVQVQTSRGIVTLSEDDIESNPKLITSQEIQDVANFVMYEVSRIITRLQKGESIPELSTANLEGMSRKDIIFKHVGLDNLINYVFNSYIKSVAYDVNEKGQWILKDFPTLEQFQNDEYDDEVYFFEDAEDYAAQKKMYEKAKWLESHKKQLILAGTAKLMTLENCIKPIEPNQKKGQDSKDTPSIPLQPDNVDASLDNGDNNSLENFKDSYIEGLSDLEAWMLGQRHMSPKASLAQEIKRMLESIDLVDDEGNPILDKYGWDFHIPLDATMATQTILDVVRHCETYSDMIAALRRKAENSQNKWINQVIDVIENKENKNITKKFFRHFRKDSLTYSICEYKLDKKTGKRVIVTRVINMKSSYDTIKQSLGATFKKGEVGHIEINGVKYSITELDKNDKVKLVTRKGKNKESYVVEAIDNYLTEVKDNISIIYEDVKKKEKLEGLTPLEKEMWIAEELQQRKFKFPKISSEDKTITQSITEILQGIGIEVPEKVVTDYIILKLKGSKTNNAMTLLRGVSDVITALKKQEEGKGIPAGLGGNSAYPAYDSLLTKLADQVQMYVESSVYQDGKTYYSYTNPSRLGHIIRNMKDSLDDDETFKNYIYNNFGRYSGWFTTIPDEDGNTEWLNDWVNQFATNEEARTALSHKVEISYTGTQYKNLGSLAFQLSILHNYFGSKDDEILGNDRYRWFALPTMSNKPTNEFIRMLRYGTKKEGSYKEEIIDKVLMNTYQQEMNRMADVLFHFTMNAVPVDKIDLTNEALIKAGWTTEEINNLKSRIQKGEITVNDVIRLGKLTSGAKFHFLWYLNKSIANDANLAQAITKSLNLLLLPEGRSKQQRFNVKKQNETLKLVREIIAQNMENIVSDELEHMREIGLFDTEQKTMRVKIPRGTTPIIDKNKIIIGDKTVSVPGEVVSVDNKTGKVTYKILKYQEEFGGKLGGPEKGTAVEDMEKGLTEFIWQDIAANINIIQITGGDLAYYGNAVNYQKRIAQIHSPGLKLMHDDEYDDGYLRSVHISDEAIRDEILYNAEAALTDYMNKSNMTDSEREEYKSMIKLILNNLTKTLATDGQSYSCISSIRKKLALQGEWDDTKEKAYKKIIKGEFDINNLGILLQPSKPFVTSDLAKYSGSTTMELRRVPTQDKNSEYLIVLAEALARGAGIRSKLAAISDFMETTHKFGNGKVGIDTAHFESVNKVGKSGIIDISEFDKQFNKWLENKEVTEDEYNELLTEYLLQHVRTAGVGTHRHQGLINRALQMSESQKTEGPRHRSAGIVGVTLDSIVKHHMQDWEDFDANERLVREGKLKREETYYNSQYVDTIPLDDYIIQQEVPAHLLQEQGQLYGSQIRILGISDISEGTEFDILDSKGNKLNSQTLVEEYKNLHAQNIRESFEDLKNMLGLSDIEDLKKEMKDSLLTLEQYVENNNLPYETRREKEAAAMAYESYIDRNMFDSIVDLPVGNPQRNEFFKKLHFILQKELSKDAKYGLDIRRACALQYDDDNNVIDFVVPLMDPIQSKRIQMLINSIIKKEINKQKISGGPVVQATAYDKDLHIKFKDSKGNILPTLEEFGGNVKAYKEFLAEKQAGIAYFECYMSIPNAELERMLTKDDGTMMSYMEAEKELSKTEEGRKAWKALTEIIGYRIPTEDKYSMLPLKIVGFLPKAAGQVIMMPQEITYLTGSDFDIDKMYIMVKKFDTTQAVADLKDENLWKNLVKEYFKETGNRWNYEWEQSVKDIIKLGNDVITGRESSWTKKNVTITKDAKWEDLSKFMEWYRKKLLVKTFKEFTDMKSSERINVRHARNNRILDLQWAVLTNKDTASKMLNPGNFIEQKKVGTMIEVITSKIINPETDEIWKWEDLKELELDEIEALLESSVSHNTTLPSSKIYFQRQNMQGSQMVGIFANNNVSHAFMTFQNVGINLNKSSNHSNSFMFNGIVVGDIDVPNSANVIDRQVGFNGKLISKTIASFLAAAVDTAKEPCLAKMNINTFTGGVAMTLARLGFDTESIGLFLRQPVIYKLSEIYFKNKTNGFYDGETAMEELANMLGISKEEMKSSDGIKGDELNVIKLSEHLNDEDYENSNDNNYQKKVFKAYYRLFQMARDMQNLTFCTKFNSVSNAVGPTIADTIEDLDKVTTFMDDIENSIFHVPSNKNSAFSDPRDIIEADPILKAFYETTVAKGGASELIFKQFFPHYFPGFQNVKDYFKENYIRGNKISSKLYNQLLDEYLYYMLTYADKKNGFNPTLPSDEKDIKKLVAGLVGEYAEVKEILKGKPNPLLDTTLGNNCLRVRGADEFLAADTLIFNGSQLNSDGQQKIRNAWSDLILMNDPELTDTENAKVRDFAVKLFFYTLMRNGFGFSPKTLMHLASTIVRYNAVYEKGYNNYIEGLKNLKDMDKYLTSGVGSKEFIKRFCNQFVRNHSNNMQLIPRLDTNDSSIKNWITDDEGNIIGLELGATEKELKKNLGKVLINDKTPCGFISVIRKENGKLYQDFYELDTPFGRENIYDDYETGGKTVRYKKTNKLGLTNNFIEYNANKDIIVSFFENIRDESEDALEDDNSGEETRDSEQNSDEDVYTSTTVRDPEWLEIKKEIRKLNSPFTEKNDRGNISREATSLMRQAKESFIESKNSDSPMAKLWKEFKENKDEETLNSIADTLKKENQCPFNNLKV